MPRKIPSYRLHRPSGRAVVTLNGTDFYLGAHGTPASQEKYSRLIAEWSAAGGKLPPVAGGPCLTVSTVLAAYLVHAEGYYVKEGKPTGQLDRVKRSLAVARRLYGSAPALEFGPRALKACRDEMVRAGLCRDQVNKRTGCLVRAFRWAVGEELIGPAVHQALAAVEGLRRGRTMAPESEPVLPADEAAIEAVLALISPVLADVIRLQLLTGARPGNALALKAAQLDRSRDVWLWKPPSHKTQHHRRELVLFVGPQAQALLAPYLLRRGGDFLFSPRESMELFRARQRAARKTPVQPSQLDRAADRPRKGPGERYSRDSYTRAVALACERAGVAHWHPHQLRHNACTRLVKQFGWQIARIVLGHRSLDVTRIYGEDDVEKAISAIREVG